MELISKDKMDDNEAALLQKLTDLATESTITADMSPTTIIAIFAFFTGRMMEGTTFVYNIPSEVLEKLVQKNMELGINSTAAELGRR